MGLGLALACFAELNFSPLASHTRSTPLMQTSRSILTRVLALSILAAIATGCSAGARRSWHLQRADRYMQAGEDEKAKIEYLKVLQSDPQNAAAFRQVGRIWLEQGSPLRAGPFLVKARELAPNDVEAHVALARVYLFAGQLTNATKEAFAALQQAPGNGDALIFLTKTAQTPGEIRIAEQQLAKFPERDSVSAHIAAANLALRKQDLAAVQNELQRAIMEDPKSSAAHLALATYLLQKEPAQAAAEFKAAAELAPPRSESRLAYGQFLAQSGKLKEARDYLKEMTSRTPDYLPAWSALAAIALSEKKYDESLSFTDTVLARDAENLEARRLQAEVLRAKGETAKAVAALEHLDKTYSSVPAIKYQLARAYLQNNNRPQAIGALEQAVSVNPDFTDATLLLAQLNLQDGKPQAVIGPMTDLLKKQPNSIPAHLFLAEAYRASGRLDDAVTVIREELNLNNPEPYVLLGTLLNQQKKTDEARTAFEKAADIAPNNLMPVTQLVNFEIANKDIDRAMAAVQRQLSKTPEAAGAHFLEGKIYVAQGKWDQAEAALRKAVELDPNFTAAYELLVSTYLATNKLPQAIAEVEAVLAKNPDNAGALMTAGLIYTNQKQFDKAAAAYEKLLAKNPNAVAALNNLSYLYAERLNQLDKALDLARKARTLQPADPSVADTFGWILYLKGDYQQAFAILQESAGKLADNPEVQFHLGMAAYMMGRSDVARVAFQKALSAPADFPGKADAQRRLVLLGDNSGQTKALSPAELEALLKDQPDDPVARLQLAEAYERQGAFGKAAACYEEALKANPRLIGPAAKLAQLYAGPLKNNEKALEFARKARDLAPSDPRIAATLGNVAYQTGNSPWAYSLLQESSRRLENDPGVLHDYAWAAYSLGKVREAQQIMQRVVTAAPNSSEAQDARTFLALTAFDEEGKDVASAEPDAQHALQTDAGYVPALMIEAAAQRQHGDATKATELYSRILQRFPDFAPAQKRLALLYMDDPANGAKVYDLATKARKSFPDDPDLAKALARVSFERKEFGRAIQLFQESGRKKPLDPTSLYYLGMSQLQANQKSPGRESLNKALAGGLGEPNAAEAKKALADLNRG